MSTPIGLFGVHQRRRRQLYTDRYSHVLVVFDRGLLLVEAARWRDHLAAAARRVPVPIPGKAVATALLRVAPGFGSMKEDIVSLRPLTPETLAAAYPNQVWRVWKDQIRSAVLKDGLRGDLKIEYASQRYGRPMELWLTISAMEDAQEVRAALSTMLGNRFRADRQSPLATAMDALSAMHMAHGIGDDVAGLRPPAPEGG